MILDNIENCQQYYSLHSGIERAFEYLKSVDLANLPVGKVEIDGKKLFFSVAEMPIKTAEECKLEIHRQYIDIQIPIDGSETMGWKSACQLDQAIGEFDIQKDYQLFEDKASNLMKVNPMEFVIFFPSDGHQPGITDAIHKKLIVKILI